MAVRTINGIDELRSLVGEHLGYSDWLEITQERVNQFAEATGDHQWIHVDVERAKAGPFGGPIAHGYLTLSLGPMLGDQVWARRPASRWASTTASTSCASRAPVPVGSNLRLGVKLLDVDRRRRRGAGEVRVHASRSRAPPSRAASPRCCSACTLTHVPVRIAGHRRPDAQERGGQRKFGITSVASRVSVSVSG